MRRLWWVAPPFFTVAVFAMRLERLPLWLLYGRRSVDHEALEAYFAEVYESKGLA